MNICGDSSDEEATKSENPSWSSGLVNSQKWSPQALHDKNRKSAFQPYKLCATSSTVLTNLQRGNTQAETLIPQTVELTFHMKAGQGELGTADILKEKDVDILDANGLSALHWSSAYGQYNTVELLISYNAEVNKLGPDGESPLILAASGGHHEVVKLLLSHGADVNHIDHVRTVFINIGQKRLFKNRMKHCLTQCELCNTALMYAAKGNHPHTCHELLLHGTTFGLVNLNDDTALSIAIENNSTSAQIVIENYIISYMENNTKKED